MTEAMARQGNHNTLHNGMDELTSAFLIHCHPRQHRVYFIKLSVVYFVSHMGATQVAFWVATGEFASHFAMRYRL